MASFNFQSSSYVSINCISDDSCTSAELDIKNPKLFNIYTTHIQSNLMLYSYNILYGDILQCDSDTHNCFIDSKILCNHNYSETCDITFIDNEFKCDECLNHIFTPYELEITMDYTTIKNNYNTIKYKQEIQYILYSSLIYLLSDNTDEFRHSIDEKCNCINEIDKHIGIFSRFKTVKKQIIKEIIITITTDLEIIHIELNKLFRDGRFKYLLNTNMILFDDSFKVNNINLISEPEANPDQQAIKTITYIIVSILGIVLIIATIGTIQMYYYDVTIYVTGILLFGLYFWDFYSDILFSYEVYIGYAQLIENRYIFLGLFIACLIFLILPIIASILSLFRFQDKWKNDQSIGDRVTGWNRDWSTYLLILTILSGSSFAAVNILNSRVFGHPLFCMGLSYRHLKKFENQRLWGVIISENIPQLIIQGIYFYYSSQQFSTILVLAFVSSSLSIIVALIDIYNNKRLFGQFSNDSDYQTILKVPVISHEVAGNQWKLALSTHRFNQVFSKIIGVDSYAIEVDLPSPNQNGLVINFSVRTVDINPKQIVEKMMRAQKNGAMAKFIQEAWNLKATPILGSIEFKQIGKKQEDITIGTESAIEMVNPLNADGKSLALDDSVTHVSFNNTKELSLTDRRRTNTVESKPYEDLDITKKHKIRQKKIRSKTNSTIPANFISENIILSDIPENIPETQTKLKIESQSESALPRQPTGAHTKKMREMRNELNEMKTSNGIKRKDIQTPLSPAGKQVKNIIDHQSEFRQYIQYKGSAPSQPQLHQNNNNQNQNQNQNNWAQSSINLNQQTNQQLYQQNNNIINQNQNQNQNQYQYQQTSQSTTNLNQYQQQGYQQGYQLPNNNYTQPIQPNNIYINNNHINNNNYGNNNQIINDNNYGNNNNEINDNNNDHIGFVPPQPHQEIDKYVQYKQKRQLRDDEKKIRLQQEREMKQLENTSPNYNYSNQKHVNFANNDIHQSGNQY